MKRSVSRTSKISVDAQDALESSFPGIPDAKWHEFLEKEENDFFILGLREEILHKCMEVCYENYLEKQAVAFTVHCAYLAWCKVLNMYYMFRDPGDTDDPKVRESWEPDPEPEPSIIDSWGIDCIKPMDHLTKTPILEKESEKEVSESVTTPITSEENVTPSSYTSHIFDVGEGEYFFEQGSFFSSESSEVSRKKSIFTRTLSMSRESLPLLDSLKLVQDSCKEPVNSVNKNNENATKQT